MARKRKLDGTVAAPSADPVADQPESDQAKGPAMGGMWGGTATNMLKQRLTDTRASIAKGVMAGTVALELHPDQVVDEAGSDRLSDWRSEPEFRALVDNIGRRGQVQPIRVRPKDPRWKPHPDDPLHSGDTFVIQSGRRRLAACRELGMPVKAVISTESGDRALADLEERFHENTMRKNLSGFEELLSVGLIAEALGDLTQEEISERLSVSQADVSLGRACVDLHDRILAEVDIANTPKRAFRTIIPQLRKGRAEKPRPASEAAVARAERQGLKVNVTPGKTGLSVTIRTGRAVDPAWLAERLADLIEKEGQS